jgi:RNA recognition motif-containing protein
MNASNGNRQEDDKKLFVGSLIVAFCCVEMTVCFMLGGLTWDTTVEDLREYFSAFGNIRDCSIKQDPNTGRSRGFAFLVFDSKDIVEKILNQSEHFIKGRKVDPKPAHRRSTTNSNHQSNNNQHHHHASSQSAVYGMGASSGMSYQSMSMGMGAMTNSYNNNKKVFIGGLDPNLSGLTCVSVRQII